MSWQNHYKALFGPGSSVQRWNKIYDNYLRPYGEQLLGYSQMKSTQASQSAQIAYEQYLKEGNRRALADWHKNVPGRTIKYPEFSYPGQIRRADTSITRSFLDYSNAESNYYGNLAFRGAGLYGIGSRVFRTL